MRALMADKTCFVVAHWLPPSGMPTASCGADGNVVERAPMRADAPERVLLEMHQAQYR
ncbi:MAG: hypothetical protein ACLU8D_05530 [Enterocloster sp.]